MKISTCDGKIFHLTTSQVELCQTLKDMLSDVGHSSDGNDNAVQIPSIHSEHFEVLHEILGSSTKLSDNVEEAKALVKLLEDDQVPFYWQCFAYASFFNSKHLTHHIGCILGRWADHAVETTPDVEQLKEKMTKLLSLPASDRPDYKKKEEEEEEKEEGDTKRAKTEQ